MPATDAQNQLLEWYRQNRRELPWRASRDPYRIWISETMLQQTTTTAVIPFFERFVKRFPTLEVLAASPLADVLEAWAGLGYYSRARNLHKAAITLQSGGGFPKTHLALVEFPGFGPYTSRAVASLAFDESVGVVDGNVIRVLSRYEGEDWEWWKGSTRAEIQARADAWVKGVSSYEMNQALMELGRTICTPKTPSCLLCPLMRTCASRREEKILERPKPKPRRAREIWTWEPQIVVQSGRILLRRNAEVPFLRGDWLPPGEARRLKNKPKSFHFLHTITHRDIYVTVNTSETKMGASVRTENEKWVRLKDLRRLVPASLVHKAVVRASGSERVRPYRDKIRVARGRGSHHREVRGTD